MNGQKLLIFGSGFIARHIAEEATTQGFDTVLLYNHHTIESFTGLRQIQLASVNLTNFIAKERPTAIIALQGNSFVPDNQNLLEALNANLLMTMSFMEKVLAAHQKGTLKLTRVIFAGSAGEYGKTYHEPIAENFPLHPTSVYGLTKIFLYNMAMFYAEKGLPVIHVRQFNCTGPHQRAPFVIPSICRQIAKIERGLQDSITIGDTTQERDFIDVRDAAVAYLLLLKSARNGEIYNIGSGHAVSIAEVLRKAISLTTVSTGIPLTYDPELFFDKNAMSKKICADITKLYSLGFEFRYTLDDTLRDTLAYWRNHV